MLASRIKQLRLSKNLTQDKLAELMNVEKTNISKWENSKNAPSKELLQKLADIFEVTTDYLLGRTVDKSKDDFPSIQLIKMNVIGSVRAGYDGCADEEYTGEEEYIPMSEFRGLPAKDFFVLRIKGDSMYPMLIDGDKVLVQRMSSVDSGSIAVVLYNGDEATVKRVQYVTGGDYLTLIPINTAYPPKTIRGADLEECRVLGKVVKLFREVF